MKGTRGKREKKKETKEEEIRGRVYALLLSPSYNLHSSLKAERSPVSPSETVQLSPPDRRKDRFDHFSKWRRFLLERSELQRGSEF